MCGIAGLVRFDPGVDLRRFSTRVRELLRHRGPDGSGQVVSGNCVLAHTRLAIIDVKGGAQPISNEDESIHLVANGEVYNQEELRRELEAKGHAFRTRTDVEVILHLYEEEGADSVLRLRGMFAFAVWDSRNSRLLLARDRLGQKPLYYVRRPEAFGFASEPKALISEGAPPEVDWSALRDYLVMEYVPGERTGFEGIVKLPPASTLVLDARSGGGRVRRYWTLEFEEGDFSARRAREALEDELDEAASLRLHADVEVGAFLSGGIDSATILSFMPKGTRAFTVGFREREYDERPVARLTASALGATHECVLMSVDVRALLPRLAWHLDDPLADSSALPTFLLAEFARERVKVVLNGDGGDESLGGYVRYRAARWLRAVKNLPRPLRALALAGAALAPGRRARKFVRCTGREGDEYVSTVTHAYPGGLLRNELAVEGTESRELERLLDEAGELPESLRYMRADLLTYLPADLLVKMDRMTMAHGLEARSPLLDHDLVELCALFPARLKRRKGLLKKIARSRGVPARVLRGKKRGFAVPPSAWRGEWARDALLGGTLAERNLVDENALARMLQEPREWPEEVWTLLFLETWMRTFAVGAPSGPVEL